MAAAREYELVLMLDPQLDAPAREALAQNARGQIEGAGTLKHENTWGLRKMAYEINRRTEADYRWFRFEAPTELLDSLDHNLKIADGVLRFRIFKVDPSAPVIVPPAVTAAPGPRERSSGGPREDHGGERREDSGDHEAPAAEAPAQEAAAPAEAGAQEASAVAEPEAPAPAEAPTPAEPEAAAEPAASADAAESAGSPEAAESAVPGAADE